LLSDGWLNITLIDPYPKILLQGMSRFAARFHFMQCSSIQKSLWRRDMKRNGAKTTVVLAVLAMAVVSMMPSAHAQQCSLGGAVGKYAFSDSGTIIGIGSRAAVGLFTFDAAGNLTGKVTASLGGNVGSTNLSGTYSVSPDCSGAASFSESDQSGNLILTAMVAIVWDNSMREARFLFTSVTLADGTPLATVVNGDARKLVP
jgi:hypothetical protein